MFLGGFCGMVETAAWFMMSLNVVGVGWCFFGSKDSPVFTVVEKAALQLGSE